MKRDFRRTLFAGGVLDIVTAAVVMIGVVLFVVALILLWRPPVEEEIVPVLIIFTVVFVGGCLIYGALACIGLVFGINALKLAKRGAGTAYLSRRIRKYLLCPILYIVQFGIGAIGLVLEHSSALETALAAVAAVLFLGCTIASIVLKCVTLRRVRKLLAFPPAPPVSPADPFA